MFKNFFVTAYRNIIKNKVYSLINLVGLTCGLTLALQIFTYVRSEMSYDKFHEKKDRLYRISYAVPNGLKLALTPPPLAVYLKDYFKEVEEVGRMYGRNVSVKRTDRSEAFEEKRVFFTDSSITKMFTLKFIKGNPSIALREKFTILLNEETAKKYFGDEDPVNQTLLFEGSIPFKVTGVVKSFPENSHIRFDMLVPYENMYDMEPVQSATIMRNNYSTNFVISHSYTYVLLKPNARASVVDAGFKDFVKKYATPSRQIGQVFTLMPVTNIHLKSDLLAEPSVVNSMTNIYIFIGVGILTLLIASINFINLSTAQSFTRLKEIGVRKILGSMRYQLIAQFLAEGFLFTLASMVLACVAFYLLLPYFNLLLDKHLVFASVVDLPLAMTCIILVLTVTLLAGSYPAYFVAQFESITALKGVSIKSGRQLLRESLIVFQLTIASILLIASLLIVKQLNFLSDSPLGFQKSHIVNVPLYSQNLNGIFRREDSTFQVRLQSYRNAVESFAGVNGTALASGSPGLGAIYSGAIPEGFTSEDKLFFANISVDYDFLKLFEVKIAGGRSFDREHSTDEKEAFIVNETAVREFKWKSPELAIGKSIIREGKKGKVVGVIRDFNFASLTAPISPLILEVEPSQFNVLAIKFENSNVKSTIDQLEHKWNELFPEKAFEFTFLDEQLNQQYSKYKNFGDIVQLFTVIAIFISCLGVYGLVLFAVQRKVKEIGIRKVLGANVVEIIKLVYKEFALVVVIGFIIAVPISIYFLNQWLNSFASKTQLDFFIYFLSFAIVSGIVSLTIGYQAVKAASANPVKSLRSE